MRKVLLVAFLFFSNYLTYGQSKVVGSTPDCYNGVQDGSELGVDCGGGCIPCNGEAQITYNNRTLKTGKIGVQNSMLKNQTGRIVEKDRKNYTFLNFQFSYENNGTKSDLSIILNYLRFEQIKPKKFYLTGGTDKDIEMIGFPPSSSFYHTENFVFLTLLKNRANLSTIKLKDSRKSAYILEITEVNALERFISGNITLQGVSSDGTPIDITGTFKNVSY